MEDAISSPRDQRVLENGLTVRAWHDPRLKRSAAYLRVHAGSHDVPNAWPGLAHFLEHLLFLGTERFADDQTLMAYVQRQGGQLNARTSERHTDYFFEVPPQALSSGLERLCDMLARPRMSPADQRREREVLHAEFVAWSRDPQAQHEFWMVSPLSAQHPLRAFHAGNRYSLPVARPEFQQSLQDFHRKHYNAGQMTLCLVGPQSAEQMLNLAQRAGQCLHRGSRLPLAVPPGMLPDAATAAVAEEEAIVAQTPGERLSLVFACAQLPPAVDQAVAFLGTWFGSSQPGGLLLELRRRGLVESLSLKAFYRHADQALINIEFKLTAAGQHATALIRELCFDWLEFFEAHDDWQGLREEYALLDKRQRQSHGALDLARHYSHCPDDRAHGLTEEGLQALRALLGQLKPDKQLHPLSSLLVKTTAAPVVHWRLPQRNRFLRPSRRPDQAIADPRSMIYLGTADQSGFDAVLTLRWRLNASRQTGLWTLIEHSLRRLTDEALQAGVKLSFSSLGDDWQLRLSGVEEPMPAILEHALECLTAPPPEVWRMPRNAEAQQALPIRHLLKQLPEHCLGHYQTQVRFAHEDIKPLKLQKLWSQARWDGMGLGIGEATRSALNAALHRLPGAPDRTLSTRVEPLRERLWSQLPTESSEHALVLFCPTPTQTVADEALWRMIAHLCQMPFYQRLRVELQLGYAVFSSFRQIAGRAGLVFGVQSPATGCVELLGHIESFLEALPKLVASQGTQGLHHQSQALSARLSVEELEPGALADTLWQAHLGGYPSSYLRQLQQALQIIQPAQLLDAVRQLQGATGGWLCLANSAAPGPQWRNVREARDAQMS
jgi:coenzyme PQQ biosynthesis probable peptidase PqqF